MTDPALPGDARCQAARTPGIRIPVDADGTALTADLYRPQTDEPVPAVVTLHYGRRTLGVRCFTYFAEMGYAAVVVDCRGTGESDGLPGPLLDPKDADDGVAVLDWVAAQPWCTGELGMWGLSSGAALALAVASRRPKQLKAIFPVMGWADSERCIVHPGGLPGGIGYLSLPCVEKLLNDLLPPLVGEDLEIRRKIWREKVENMSTWAQDAWEHPPGDPDWRNRKIDAANIVAATCLVGGWQDVCRDAVISLYEQIDAPKNLVVGPWLHDLPENALDQPMDSLAMARDWWDRWLRPDPIASGQRDPVALYVEGDDPHWTSLPAWPSHADSTIAFTATSGLELVPAGRIARTAEPTSVAKVTDPTAGPLSGLWTLPISDIGFPLDEHDDDNRSMSVTSGPVPRAFTILGRPTLNLAMSARTTAHRCVAKLTDVDEDGRSRVVATGLTDLPPASARVTVALDPTCYRVARGHRLRLVLSESDFPRLWPAVPNHSIAIEVADPNSTRLELPIVDGPPVAEQPYPGQVVDRHAVKFSQQPAWVIARDHFSDTVSVELSGGQDRLYTSDGARIREREFSICAQVAKDDPAAATLQATARFLIDTDQAESLVVRAEIAVGRNGRIATGEVVIDGETVVSRRWGDGR